MSRLPRLLRFMHTGTRQIPNPGQGGAPSTTSISPTSHGHLPPTPHSDHLGPENPNLGLDLSAPTSSSSHTISSGKYTAKGKPIPTRPARRVQVRLPSGDLEPTSYPPSAEYIASLESNRSKPHPLWQFFRVPEESRRSLTSSSIAPLDYGSLESVEPDDKNLKGGRSWSAAELRGKSWGDLHTLWYLLLKERNVIATQREERRRLGISAREGGDLITKKAFKCRKSMARIKYVLNERRLGLIAASSSIPALQDLRAGVGRIETYSTGVVEETESGETPPIVGEGEVAKEEVESRDEGWGSEKEDKDFVKQVEESGTGGSKGTTS